MEGLNAKLRRPPRASKRPSWQAAGGAMADLAFGSPLTRTGSRPGELGEPAPLPGTSCKATRRRTLLSNPHAGQTKTVRVALEAWQRGHLQQVRL